MPAARRTRIRQASHADVIAGLTQSGIQTAVADSWCDLWEAEAMRQGIAPDSEYYWDAAKGWIDAHRGSTRPLD